MPGRPPEQRPIRRFGLLRYRDTHNLGDEIQSLAAKRFLPRIDNLVEREALSRRPLCRGSLALILNGWFTHDTSSWPPHPTIRPLLTSLHLSDQFDRRGFSAAEALVVGRNAAYLREHGPVGARDLWTHEILRRNDIEAYFSGCLTLTLQKPVGAAAHGAVVVNDLDPELAAAVRTAARARVISSTHEAQAPHEARARLALAESLLALYAGACAVVTSRLHCALPCLAIGTPVLFVPRRPVSNRLPGLIELLHTASAEALRAGKADYDFDNPPPNPERHLPLRRALENGCAAFVAAVQNL